MSTTYPTSKDAFTNPSAASAMTSPSHSAQHANENDAILALETKVGITGDSTTSSHDYKLSGVTGSDKAASLAGTENLTNKQLNGYSTSTTAVVNTIPVAGTSGYLPPESVGPSTVASTANKLFIVTATGTPINLGGVMADIAGLTATVTIPTGGRSVMLMLRVVCQQNTDGNSNLQVQFVGGGSNIGGSQNYAIVRSGYAMTVPTFIEDTTPASGSRTYKIQASYTGGAAVPFISSAEFSGYLI